MNKKNESIKAAAFLAIGIMFGVLIMLSAQFTGSSEKGRANQSSTKTNEGAATQSSTERNASAEVSGTNGEGQTQTAQAVSRPNIAGLKPCPNPLDVAMSQLNAPMMYQVQGNQLVPLQEGQTITVAPGDTMPSVSPGYQGAGDIVQAGPYQQVSGQYHALPALPVGRNGLLANPCVDPPSVHGIAYTRQYQ